MRILGRVGNDGVAVAVLLAMSWPMQGRLAAQAANPAATAQAQAAALATAERDHQREMDELGIKELRPPVGAGPHALAQVNYDESKANVYGTLPDPLKLKDGKRVTTAKEWWGVRRPEIEELFSREIVGRVPANAPKVKWVVLNAAPLMVAGVPALVKRVEGEVDNSAWPAITVKMEMMVVTPLHAQGPVPVIMQFAFTNEWAAALPGIDLPLKPALPGADGPPWQQQVLERGWGYALLLPTSLQPDDHAQLEEGVIGLADKGQPRKLDAWGCLRAWAWGASRAMDYLETDKNVDAKQVGLEGHSRFGKTALVAMAYDRRFAVAYVSSSGEGGAKLYRHNYGEDLTNLAGVSEFHWVDGNFLRYAGPLTTGDLPVDSHELIALCAPRPVFIGGGDSAANKDGWADPTGMFLAEVAASPVYELLGKKGVGATTMPAEGTALIDGELGFRQHPFGHTPGPNWPAFLEFAGHYLHAQTGKR